MLPVCVCWVGCCKYIQHPAPMHTHTDVHIALLPFVLSITVVYLHTPSLVSLSPEHSGRGARGEAERRGRGRGGEEGRREREGIPLASLSLFLRLPPCSPLRHASPRRRQPPKAQQGGVGAGERRRRGRREGERKRGGGRGERYAALFPFPFPFLLLSPLHSSPLSLSLSCSPRASLLPPFLLHQPHNRSPCIRSQAAGSGPFSFLLSLSLTPLHPGTIGRPPSRGPSTPLYMTSETVLRRGRRRRRREGGHPTHPSIQPSPGLSRRHAPFAPWAAQSLSSPPSGPPLLGRRG